MIFLQIFKNMRMEPVDFQPFLTFPPGRVIHHASLADPETWGYYPGQVGLTHDLEDLKFLVGIGFFETTLLKWMVYNGVSKKNGVSNPILWCFQKKWMVYFMENPIKIHDLGGPPLVFFWNTHIALVRFWKGDRGVVPLGKGNMTKSWTAIVKRWVAKYFIWWHAVSKNVRTDNIPVARSLGTKITARRRVLQDASPNKFH